MTLLLCTIMLGALGPLTTSIVASTTALNQSFRTAEALIQRGDYERALDHLIDLELNTTVPEIRAAAALRAASLYEAAQKHETAIRLLSTNQRLLPEASSLAVEAMQWEIARLFLIEGHYQEALANIPETSIAISRLSLAKAELEEITNYSRVSGGVPPVTALPAHPAWFASASFVPGLGQMLLGYPLDALTSVAMIGVPAWLGIRSLDRGEATFGRTCFLVSGLFYAGGISSTWRMAERKRTARIAEYNLRVAGKLTPRIQVHWQPPGYISIQW